MALILHRLRVSAHPHDRPAAIAGKTDLEMPWSAFAETYRADDREVVETRRAKRGITEPFHHADGRQLWIATSKVPLIDEAGRQGNPRRPRLAADSAALILAHAVARLAVESN